VSHASSCGSRAPGAKTVTKTISVVLVDDNVVARDAVADLIRQRPGFKVLVASSNATDAVGKVREGKARAVLLDSRLYDHDSLRLIVTLRDKQPETRIIVTGIRPHQRDLTCFVRAGASGFILKDASLDETLESIREVIKGGHVLPQRLVGSLFKEIAEKRLKPTPPNDRGPSTLTNREREVLALIGDGLGTKEIANRLHIAVDTVRSHVANLFEKRGVRTRLQLAAFARADGERYTQVPREASRNSREPLRVD